MFTSVTPHFNTAPSLSPPLPNIDGHSGTAQLTTAKQTKISPEKNTDKGVLDYLAKLALGALLTLSLIMLFSRPLAYTAKILTAEKLELQKSRPRSYAFLSKLADPEQNVKKLKRWIYLAALIQLSSALQISINTEQPSKFLAALLYGIRSLFMVIRPTKWAESLNFFGSMFWFSGERNDIENSNHPEKRRGLNLKLLITTSPDGKHRLNRDGLTQAKYFIIDDLKYALSFQPWKELSNHLRNPSGTGKGTPQSYQTALGAQFNLFAWIGLIAMLYIKNGSQRFKRGMPILKNLSRISAGASIILPSIPLAQRAWQSHHEMDGAFTLTGIPLATIARVALASPALSAVSGIGGVGQALIQEGKRLNSKKYHALVNYLQALYYRALRQPDLTAHDVLKALKANPKALKALQKSMGEVRVNYLFTILEKGAANPKVPLWAYLYPLTLSEGIRVQTQDTGKMRPGHFETLSSNVNR